VVAGVLVAAGALLGSPFGRRRVLAPSVRVGRELARALRSPRQALGLFGGAAGVTLGNAVALVTCLAAFDPHFPVLSALAVYVGGSAIASPAPTPGKLGAVEAALVAGLTGIGVHSEPAVAAVLTFRLISFWIPIVPGLGVFRYLQHRRIV
jgi:glycosyltransferase 2 family protein